MAKRRHFSSQFKAQLVLSYLRGEKSAVEICREHQLHPNVFSRWHGEFQENAWKVFEKGDGYGELQERVSELERLVGRLTLENEILKKALGH